MRCVKKILIVDDLYINRKMLNDILSDMYIIIEAKNGNNALEMLERDAKSIDLIITDIVMPELDGLELMKQMQNTEKWSHIPVMVLTSYEEKENEMRALALGALDVILRPFDPAVIKHRIQNILKLAEVEHLRVENSILKENKEVKAKLQAVLNGTNGGIYRLLCEGDLEKQSSKLIYANDSYYRIRGIKKDSLDSRYSYEELNKIEFPEDHLEICRRIKGAIIEKKKGIEWETKIKRADNGEVRILQCNGGITITKKGAIIDVVETDITEQRKLQSKLETLSRQFQILVDNVPGGIAIIEKAEKISITYFNEAICQMCGYTKKEYEEIVKQDISSIICPDDFLLLNLELKRAAQEETNADIFLRFIHKSGNYVWIKMNAKAIEHNENNVIFYAAFSDVNELKEKSERDALTTLYNRATFLYRMENLLVDKRFYGKISALFMIDLDNFKSINDIFGHSFGDEVLIDVASRISSSFRSIDIVGRIGGDEFVVFMPYVSSIEAIEKKAAELCNCLHLRFRKENAVVEISASIGIALAPQHGSKFDVLYKKADKAQYLAKKSGKNNYVLYRE